MSRKIKQGVLSLLPRVQIFLTPPGLSSHLWFPPSTPQKPLPGLERSPSIWLTVGVGVKSQGPALQCQ